MNSFAESKRETAWLQRMEGLLTDTMQYHTF
jgi:hypothetical protein